MLKTNKFFRRNDKPGRKKIRTIHTNDSRTHPFLPSPTSHSHQRLKTADRAYETSMLTPTSKVSTTRGVYFIILLSMYIFLVVV